MTLNLMMPAQGDDLRPRITVFGVGGAGGNAVNNMIDKALDGVEFVVGNTDAQALAQSRAPQKVQLGVKATEGLGAGARPAVGASAAEESIEQIVDHLAGAHMCFITAGMGGGTGTGAAPIIAQAARELGVLTVGVVTKPFMFEGPRRMRQAEEGVEALQKVVDTLIIIPNQNLFRLASMDTSITDAFQMADDVLYLGVKGVTDLMVKPGLINLDFADVRSVMDEMGKAMMGTGEATSEEFPENRAKTAAQAAIANPLLDEMSLKSAKGVLINVTGGRDMTLFELDEAANTIRESVDGDANIIVGSTLDDEMQGRMRVSVVATGIDATEVEVAHPMPRRKLAEPIRPARHEAGPAREEARSDYMLAEAPAPFEHAPPQRRAAERAGEHGAEHGAEPQRERGAEREDRMVLGDHDLPPPAYTPRPEPRTEPRPEPRSELMPPARPQARLEARPEARPEERRDSYADARLGAEPGRFVAPRAPSAQTPASGERAARIQQAASRAGRPLGGAPQRPAAAPSSPVERGRRSINGLIGRMTGHPVEPDPRFEPAPRRPVAVTPRPERLAERQPESQPERQAEPAQRGEDPEPDRIEIPAFLRRQAN